MPLANVKPGKPAVIYSARGEPERDSGRSYGVHMSNQRLLVVGVSALLVLGSASGCGRAQGSEATTTPTPEAASTNPAAEAPSSQPTDVVAPDNPDYTPRTPGVKDGVEIQVPERTKSDFIDSGEFTGEHLEQRKTLEEMQKMTLQEFAKLPYGDRIAFAALTYYKPGREFHAPFQPVGNDDFDGFAWGLPSSWQELANSAFGAKDPDTRAKLAGAYSYYTTDKLDGKISSSYQAAADTVVRNGGEGVFGSFAFEYVSNGKVQHGIDRDGKPIDFMNVTYKQGFTSTIKSVEDVKTGQAIRSGVTLLDGREFTYYVLGYVTEGVKSPADGYDY